MNTELKKNHLLFPPLNFSFSLILIQYTEQKATRGSILVKPYIIISYEKQQEEHSQALCHLGAGTSLEYLSLSPHADEATWRQGGRMITECPWQRCCSCL